MAENIKNIYEKIKIMYHNSRHKKRIIYFGSLIFIALFVIALNITYSAFSGTEIKNVANIKVAGMEYSMTINSIPGTIITANNNEVTKSNVILTSLNNIASQYELIYKVCSDSSCTSFIEKPVGLTIEYSSKTIDEVSGLIVSSGNKSIRVIVTNETETTYYIQLDINAGYSHNTLALKGLITAEYNEEDVIIAAIIGGEI